MPRKGVKGEEVTEEEKLLQLQQRAQAEEEMAGKKEETLTLYLKDKLQREQRKTAMNQQKLTDNWRKIQRMAQDSEQLAKVEVLQQTSERTLDELDLVIQRLCRELQEGERRVEQVQRSHLQQVEYLWEQQQKRLLGLQQMWESSLQDLSSTSRCQRDTMLADLQHQNHKLVVLDLPAQMHHAAMSESLQEVQQQVVNYKQKTDLDLDVLKKDMQNLAEGPVQSQNILQEIRDHLDRLDQQMSKEQQEISTKLRKVKRLKDQACQLRNQIPSHQAEKLKQDLTSTNLKLRQQSLQLQDQLARDRQEAKKKLVDISLQGHAATKNLQAVISKGERLLKLEELCHKMEVKLHLPVEDGRLRTRAEQEVQGVQELQQRLNTALLHREALRKQRKDLRQENQQLQALLDQHHDLQGHPAPLPVLQVSVDSGPRPVDRRRMGMKEAQSVKLHLPRRSIRTRSFQVEQNHGNLMQAEVLALDL